MSRTGRALLAAWLLTALALTSPALAQSGSFPGGGGGGGSGVTTVPRGGTADTTLTIHGLLVGNAAAAVNVTAAGASGALLIGQGSSADPTWNAMSGDCTITLAGAITCTKTATVSFGSFATGTDAANLTGTVASARIAGAYTGITGVGTLSVGSIPAGLITGLNCAAISDATAFCSLSATNGVLLSMLPQLTADQVLGRFAGTTGNMAGATLTSCSAATSAVTYNTTTHAWGCNTITPGTGTVTSVTCNGGLSGGAITTSGTCSLNLANNNTWTAAQRSTPATVAISTATFTPNFDTAQNYVMTLVHASCPCTIANPSTTPVAGQTGVIEIVQSATGSDTVGTWGSQYVAAGGTSTLTLSTAANAQDYLSYFVIDSTHILVSAGALNASH